MKKKALVLASVAVITAPSICITQTLPSDLVGLNLGEIQASSFLNQPFRGVIPFLFTSVEKSKHLNVRLAPKSVFTKIGAEKLPILNNLNFHIAVKANKPVILISSSKPIQLPFLNFVLEVQGPDGLVYQDYTVLLDPPSYQQKSLQATKALYSQNQPVAQQTNKNLLLETFSSQGVVGNNSSKHRVKSGESVSIIAKKQGLNNVPLKRLIQGIYKKNPSAFINDNINKLKAGALLALPTLEELNRNEYALAIDKKIADKKLSSETASLSSKDTYKVNKGDNLSKITKQFVAKGASFTKMMNAIFTANPAAFSRNNKSLLKTGAILQIPVFENNANDQQIAASEQESSITETEASTQIPKVLENLSLSSSSDSSNTANNIETEETAELKEGEYRVKEGDSLAKIAKDIGYKDASFSKMMKAIFLENPDSFEKNNITKLIIGSVIHLPALSDVEKITDEPEVAQTDYIDTFDETEATTEIQAKETTVVSSLEKRIRELRAELNQAKSGLSSLEVSLKARDRQIDNKNIELVNLKSNYIKLKINQTSDGEEIDYSDDEAVFNQLYDIQPGSEISQLAIDSNKRNKAPGVIDRFLKSYTNGATKKDLAYFSLALLLGLILIRYRREIYSYTNINYDHPNYYPAPKAGKYQLSERNINYQDTLVDPELFTSGVLPEKSPVEDEQIDQAIIGKYSPEESEEIQHCEHLITELFDDLYVDTEVEVENDEWENIEKVCDDYIDNIKEDESISTKLPDEEQPEKAVADFEVMMSDLLESLNEVEESINNNAKDSEDHAQELIDDELLDIKDDEATA